MTGNMTMVTYILLVVAWRTKIARNWSTIGQNVIIYLLPLIWARDPSKTSFCRYWLALSNVMKSAGNARHAVHVQGDWKLCTCIARQNEIFGLEYLQDLRETSWYTRKIGSRFLKVLNKKHDLAYSQVLALNDAWLYIMYNVYNI